MAVVYCTEQGDPSGEVHAVRIYALAPTLKLIRTIGMERSNSPGGFNAPYGVTFVRDKGVDTIVVCETTGGRIQELSLDGTSVRTIRAPRPTSIAIRDDLIVVGSGSSSPNWHLHLFTYRTGTHLRSFGPKGHGSGQIGGEADGVCISPDGKHVIVLEGMSNKRMSVFTVGGAFVKHIGLGVLGGFGGVCAAPNGDLVVADFENNQVCVFSFPDGVLLRKWGKHGRSRACEFDTPPGIALSCGKAYVLDLVTSRVQVFE